MRTQMTGLRAEPVHRAAVLNGFACLRRVPCQVLDDALSRELLASFADFATAIERRCVGPRKPGSPNAGSAARSQPMSGICLDPRRPDAPGQRTFLNDSCPLACLPPRFHALSTARLHAAGSNKVSPEVDAVLTRVLMRDCYCHRERKMQSGSTAWTLCAIDTASR
jgi:hypothetical protein